MLDVAAALTPFALLGVGVVIGFLATAGYRRMQRRERHRRGRHTDDDDD